jgi:hypothetical protein
MLVGFLELVKKLPLSISGEDGNVLERGSCLHPGAIIARTLKGKKGKPCPLD